MAIVKSKRIVFDLLTTALNLISGGMLDIVSAHR